MRAIPQMILAVLALASVLAAPPRGAGELRAVPGIGGVAAGDLRPGDGERCLLFARTFWSSAAAEPGASSARTRPDKLGPAKSGPPAFVPFERGSGSGRALLLVGSVPRASREPCIAQAFLRVNGSADAQGARA